mmetsp:Transcript_36876/g.98226  ORF Transcript_36876/g.98226 Transcript_36876/m.98226 type:complete len:93 (+) Transcript_36876:3054-3332(+)
MPIAASTRFAARYSVTAEIEVIDVAAEDEIVGWALQNSPAWNRRVMLSLWRAKESETARSAKNSSLQGSTTTPRKVADSRPTSVVAEPRWKQ